MTSVNLLPQGAFLNANILNNPYPVNIKERLNTLNHLEEILYRKVSGQSPSFSNFIKHVGRSFANFFSAIGGRSVTINKALTYHNVFNRINGFGTTKDFGKALLAFSRNPIQNTTISAEFLKQIQVQAQNLAKSPNRMKTLASLQQIFSTNEGQQFFLDFLARATRKKEDCLLQSTLTLFPDLPTTFNKDNLLRTENLMNTTLIDGEDRLVSVLFKWCKRPILEGKMPLLDKEIFLLEGVQQSIDSSNKEEMQSFLNAVFNFSSKSIEKALFNEQMKDISNPQDEEPLYQDLKAGRGIDAGSFVIFRDSARAMNYSIKIEGHTLEIPNKMPFEEISKQLTSFLQNHKLSDEGLRRLADFITNFPSQGILATSYTHGWNALSLKLEGLTTVRVSLNSDNTTSVGISIQSTAANNFIVNNEVVRQNTDIDVDIRYKYTGSMQDNKCIPTSIQVSDGSFMRPEGAYSTT